MTVTPLMKIDTLKLVYFVYFHSIISHGVIMWRNSTDNKKSILHPKKIIGIMAGTEKRVL
jgi:hypothetical protein